MADQRKQVIDAWAFHVCITTWGTGEDHIGLNPVTRSWNIVEKRRRRCTDHIDHVPEDDIPRHLLYADYLGT